MQKLPIVVAAVLAVAAFSVLPALAQAAPHYYKGGFLIPEGEKVPVLEWAQLTYTAEPEGLGGPPCEEAAGGFIENPVGGGAGRGQIARFSTWNCLDPECPEAAVEINGQKYEKQFEIIAPPQDLPWPSELTEKEAGKIRTNSTGVVFTIGCYAHGLTKAEEETGKPTGPGENEQYPLAAPTICETNSTHFWEPEHKNGTNQGNNQSQLIFNQPAGSGPSCANGAVTARIGESLKAMGYEASQLITVK